MNLILSKETISYVDLLLFTRHLSVMLKSGISIGEALQLLASQATKNLKHVIQAISKDVENGKTLAQAFAAHPHVFDPFYLQLIEIGETSGTLQESLDHLSKQLRKKYDLNKKVKGALLYPTIILVAAFIAGGGLGLFVLPQLIVLFESLNVDLPLSTKILLFIATVMKDYGFFIVGGFLVLLLLLRVGLQHPRIKPSWHRFLLSIPVLGSFFQNVELAEFCRNMGIMLQSGMPITQCLASQEQASVNLVYKKYVGQIRKQVEKGKSIEESLNAGTYPFVPLIMTKMIGVGERTGKLDESLLYLGDFFEDEVDDKSRNFSAILEPIILLVVGIIVAFIAFAIISPIYEFTGSIK